MGTVRNAEGNGRGLIGMVPVKKPKTKDLTPTEKGKARCHTVKTASNAKPQPEKKKLMRELLLRIQPVEQLLGDLITVNGIRFWSWRSIHYLDFGIKSRGLSGTWTILCRLGENSSQDSM